MRRIGVITALLALASCGGPETGLSTREFQSRAPDATAGVPGPVAVPTLSSASSALGANQILCDSYQHANDDEDGPDDGDDDTTSHGATRQCAKTASSLYQEIQVQLVSLTSPSTLNRGLASIGSQTTFLFPDGSYTQGADALNASRPQLFGSNSVVGIQNKFIYKPLNKNTVIAIGDPRYTLDNSAAIDSVQFHVYTRSHGGHGLCRSLSNLSGKVCWSEVAGEWAYKRPFTGTSYPHAISTIRSQIPTSPSYLVVLEPERIVCDGSFRAREGDTLTCEQAAREFYKEIEFQVLALTDPNTATSGLAALDSATTFVYPNGLVTEGIAALATNLANLFGENWGPVGIENKFLYKAIDADTVLFIGDPMFTMRNFVTGQQRTTESVQVSVYRRNGTSLGSCRSATNPNGDVCWTELAEQWVYGQPVLGN